MNCPQEEYGIKNLKTFFNINLCKNCTDKKEKSTRCWSGVYELLVSRFHYYQQFIDNKGKGKGKGKDFYGTQILLDPEQAKELQNKITEWISTANKYSEKKR